MAELFQVQMNQAAGSIGVDPTDDDGEGEGSGDLGMGAQTPALLAGLMGLSPALTPAVAQAGAGASGALAALGGAAGQATAAAGGLDAGQLNAPVTSAGVATASAARNARVVAGVARQHGVDPTLAVAMMLVESGGNNRAVGDGGTSFGLFQLHRGGMLTAAGLTPDQAFDPVTNAGVALRSLAHEQRKGAGRTPGAIAAASQRPADVAGYAAKVDATMARAQQLLAGV